MHAIRNIRLCTKDCLCLYVCPTGATDTENGQIDASKCLEGCRACVDACPSHAISLAPDTFPPPQEKKDSVKQVLLALAQSKSKQEQISIKLAADTDNPVLRQLAVALKQSNRIMTEDLLRESGFMLPQSDETHAFLKNLQDNPPTNDFPVEIVQKLLGLLRHTT